MAKAIKPNGTEMLTEQPQAYIHIEDTAVGVLHLAKHCMNLAYVLPLLYYFPMCQAAA